MKGIGLLILKGRVIDYDRNRIVNYERNRVIDYERNTDFRCEVLFFLDPPMSRTLSKFSLPFDEATTSVHFPKALKRPRNNAGPASLY